MKDWIRALLYPPLFVCVMYLYTFFHELGHAVACICLGGTVSQFVVNLDCSGHVLCQLSAETHPHVIVLFLVSGGIGAALFFMALTHWSKGFAIPSLFCLIDGYAEAMYLADARTDAYLGVMLSTFFVCMWLFLRFWFRRPRDRWT